MVTLRQGVDTELGKKIQRLIKDSKLKVQAAIQDKQVRVTGKNRDDLQSAIAMVKKGGFDLPLQFTTSATESEKVQGYIHRIFQPPPETVNVP